MIDPILVEQLDQTIDRLLSGQPLQELSGLAAVASELMHLPDEAFKLRLKSELQRRATMPASTLSIREGFRTVTPYITLPDGEPLIAFLKAAFGAQETLRHIPGPGRLHAELRIGDSMVMIGAGPGDGNPIALHIFVDDCDAVFVRALAAGAKNLGDPADRPYGERSGFVEDPFGNVYFIATRPGGRPPVDVVPYLFPQQAKPYIDFLTRAFGGESQGVYEEGGRVMHASVRIGDAVVEMGEAQGNVPRGSSFMMYVDDVDAAYARAVAAGAISVRAPGDRPYGQRDASVLDPAGYTWHPAKRL